MNNAESVTPTPAVRDKFKRKAVSISSESLVKTQGPSAEFPIPLFIEAVNDHVDLASWASQNKEFINAHLLKHRALLFRGFQIKTPAHFEWFVKATSSGPLLEYKDRSTPRYEVTQRVYVSTIYPADQRIHLHNEGTYWMNWPLKIYFCAMKAAETGGETPIADVRNVYNRIDPAIRDEFELKKVMYVRNYNPGIGLTWQDAFQTTDTAVVEEYAQKNEIHVEWKDDGHLLTRQVRPAVRKHPVTGESVWFNHAAFFHVSSLDPGVRDALLSSYGEEGLPYNTYYGDGTRIDPAVTEHVRGAYLAEKLLLPWKEKDVLMLDNMSVAHAREPYTGDRHVIVAMTEAQSNAS